MSRQESPVGGLVVVVDGEAWQVVQVVASAEQLPQVVVVMLKIPQPVLVASPLRHIEDTANKPYQSPSLRQVRKSSD